MTWFNDDWLKRKKFTVDKDKVGSALSDFPVLVSVTDTDLADAQGDGDDFVVTASNGSTQLKTELEEWDGASILVLWFKATSLSAVADTVFYLYWSNAGAADQHDPTNVWDANFALVCHMSDVTTSTVADSTSNGNDGTKIGANQPVETTGQIDKGQELDGINDRISFGNDASLNTTAAITMEAWIDWDAAGDTAQRIFDKAAAAPSMYINIAGDDRLAFFGKVGGVQRDFAFGDTAILAGWKHLAITYDDADDTFRAYLNGVADGTNNAFSGPLTADGNTLYLGDRADSARSLNGGLDEVRWSTSIARTAAWLLTGYNNQSAPSAFMSFGPADDRFGHELDTDVLVESRLASPVVTESRLDAGGIVTESRLAGTITTPGG